MNREIFKHYDAFYNMILSTTMMSNAQTSEFDEDSGKIIQFIGNFFKLSQKLIDDCKKIILE